MNHFMGDDSLKIITRNVGFIDKNKIKKRKRRAVFIDKNDFQSVIFMNTVFPDKDKHFEKLVNKADKKEYDTPDVDQQQNVRDT